MKIEIGENLTKAITQVSIVVAVLGYFALILHILIN